MNDLLLETTLWYVFFLIDWQAEYIKIQISFLIFATIKMVGNHLIFCGQC